MDSDPWEVVVCGVAVCRATGEARPVRMGWSAGEGGGSWFLACDGRELKDDGVPIERLARYTRLIFADGSPPTHRAPVADPVNLDGSPRNRLLDRLARRGLETEAMAAD